MSFNKFHNNLVVSFVAILFTTTNLYTQKIPQKSPRWIIKNYQLRIEYYINEIGIENHTEWIEAAKNAFKSWENVTGRIIKFEFKGLKSFPFDLKNLEGSNLTPNINIITFIRDNWPEVWKHRNPDTGEFVPQIANIQSYNEINPVTRELNILNFNIFINAEDYCWKTESPYFHPSCKTFDIENALCHEIGHIIGLPDLEGDEYKNCTMYKFIFPGEAKKRTLEKKDILMFQELYRDYLLRLINA